MHEFVKTASALDDLDYAAGNLLTAIEDGTYEEAATGGPGERLRLPTMGWLEAHDPQFANALNRVARAYKELHS